MNRVSLLCAMDRAMMETFSRRTVEGLKEHALFSLALPPFRSFLDINVSKEVEKDRLVIIQAAALLKCTTKPVPDHVTTLLHEARKIDESFLRKASVFPIDIQIRYQDIEHYRKQRIELLLETSYRILEKWQEVNSFRKAVHKLYNEEQFCDLLHNILKIYTMETHVLSRSVRIPPLLFMARDAVMQTVTKVMEREAKVLAKNLAHIVYRRAH